MHAKLKENMFELQFPIYNFSFYLPSVSDTLESSKWKMRTVLDKFRMVAEENEEACASLALDFFQLVKRGDYPPVFI